VPGVPTPVRLSSMAQLWPRKTDGGTSSMHQPLSSQMTATQRTAWRQRIIGSSGIADPQARGFVWTPALKGPVEVKVPTHTIVQAISKMRTDSASGPDGMCGGVLRGLLRDEPVYAPDETKDEHGVDNGGYSLRVEGEPLSGLLQGQTYHVIQSVILVHFLVNVLPDDEVARDVLRAKLVGIPKGTGGSAGVRTIAVQNALGNLVSKVTLATVQQELTAHMHPGQFARAGRSASDMLWTIVNMVQACATDCVVVQLDFQSAYDSVEHAVLQKRMEKLGISKDAQRRIAWHLTQQTYRIGPAGKQEIVRCTKGVPQGSPLAPILWLVLIAQVHEELQEYYEQHGFNGLLQIPEVHIPEIDVHIPRMSVTALGSFVDDFAYVSETPSDASLAGSLVARAGLRMRIPMEARKRHVIALSRKIPFQLPEEKVSIGDHVLEYEGHLTLLGMRLEQGHPDNMMATYLRQKGGRARGAMAAMEKEGLFQGLGSVKEKADMVAAKIRGALADTGDLCAPYGNISYKSPFDDAARALFGQRDRSTVHTVMCDLGWLDGDVWIDGLRCKRYLRYRLANPWRFPPTVVLYWLLQMRIPTMWLKAIVRMLEGRKMHGKMLQWEAPVEEAKEWANSRQENRLKEYLLGEKRAGRPGAGYELVRAGFRPMDDRITYLNFEGASLRGRIRGGKWEVSGVRQGITGPLNVWCTFCNGGKLDTAWHAIVECEEMQHKSIRERAQNMILQQAPARWKPLMPDRQPQPNLHWYRWCLGYKYARTTATGLTLEDWKKMHVAMWNRCWTWVKAVDEYRRQQLKGDVANMGDEDDGDVRDVDEDGM
jgi:hypothetical protein